MKQHKYSDNLGFELKRHLLIGETLKFYFNKREFSKAHLFKEYTQRLPFDAFPEHRVIQMLQASSDFERGKILFENLAHLSRREASDIGLWNYLSHNELYRVVHKMWPEIENPPNKSSSESYVLNHWIMTNSSQSELMDYPLSGLWWSFYLTVDENRKDRYELTRVFFKNLTFRTKSLGQSKIARHKEAVIGILEFVKENGLDQGNFEENGNAIVPYLNLLGGVKPLGVFDRTWFKAKLNRKFRNDIQQYGRLFRRTERPFDKAQVAEAQEEPVKEEKSIVCVWEDGIELTNTLRNGVSFQLELDFSKPNHALFIVLKNGFVKKIDAELLEVLELNQKKTFVSRLTAQILSVFYTDSNSLLLVCFMNTLNKKSLKIYDGVLIGGRNFNAVSIHVNSMIKGLKIIPLPNSFGERVPSLVKNYPEGALSIDDFLAKDEIEILKPIIQERQMFG
jgi:hypothetical protein